MVAYQAGTNPASSSGSEESSGMMVHKQTKQGAAAGVVVGGGGGAVPLAPRVDGAVQAAPAPATTEAAKTEDGKSKESSSASSSSASASATSSSASSSSSSAAHDGKDEERHHFPPCPEPDKCVVEDHEKRAASNKLGEPRGASCEFTEKCVSACAAYGKVCPCAARVAAHAAHTAVHDVLEGSRLFTPDIKSTFTYISAEDVTIGAKLGEGGFCYVNVCTMRRRDEEGRKVIAPASGSGEEGIQVDPLEEKKDDRNDAAAEPNGNHDEEYAIKYLKRKTMVNLHQFKHGASDLAIESHFLQVLSHENIISLRGVTAGSIETNVATGKECGYFLVVDRLYDTLETRIDRWRKFKEQHQPNLIQRMSADYKNKKKREVLERCSIALQIAKAMDYIHDQNVLYRDLKPDNIGFDINGTLKLFDFGLAKELRPSLQLPGGRYELTGNTGSRRYMAPEVAMGRPYNLSVDVYSFGILLWELLSLEKPFYGYSSNKHMHRVVLGGERPVMDTQHTYYWPLNIQWLIKKCWCPVSTERPLFPPVVELLEEVVHGEDGVPCSSSSSDPAPNHQHQCNDNQVENIVGSEQQGKQQIDGNKGGADKQPFVGGVFSLFNRSQRRRSTSIGSYDAATKSKSTSFVPGSPTPAMPPAATGTGSSKSKRKQIKRATLPPPSPATGSPPPLPPPRGGFSSIPRYGSPGLGPRRSTWGFGGSGGKRHGGGEK